MTDTDASTGVGAAPIPPVVGGNPEEVADGVFVIADRRVPLVPNVGIIVGDRAALVVDTGMGPRNGVVVLEAARELAGDRPLFLTLTHFHPEHGYGAQAFGDAATIVYNREQRDEFLQKAHPYLEMFRGMGGEVEKQLEGVEFVDPHLVYEDAADFELGGKVVRLRSRGTAHTRGDQTVYLPDEGVLFTGDLVENRFFPILPFFPPHDTDVDGGKWIGVLDELERLAPGIVVPGHGEISDAGVIAAVREYLTMLRDETERLAGEGNDADEIVAALDPRMHALHPDWDNPEWIALGVRAFLAK
ncbi:MAG TPA: MBL fold metallo-hydrolase [Thermoleophilaceae bacterium]|nr:MBL fold metallo-hydrolase [Thermoleophilaceae bacterium]